MTARDRAGLGSTLNLKLCCVPTKSKSHQHQNQDSPVSEKSNSSSQTPTGSNRVALEQRPIAIDMVQPARPLPPTTCREQINSGSLSRNQRLTDSTADLGFCGLTKSSNSSNLTCGVA